MIGIKDKYLIVSMNDDLLENQHLLNILSDFEYKEDSELHFILNERYSESFNNKLINIFGYISGLHYINHFIKVFTADDLLITKFKEKKERLYINGVEVYSLLDTINQKIVELDTRRIKVEYYTRILIIDKDKYSIYDPNIYYPEIKIAKIKGN